MRSSLATALVFLLIPCAVCGKERGAVVDIWGQRDSYGNRFYIYQVETDTHIYDFLGNESQVLHASDIITFAINMHHRQVRVSAGGRKLKLFLLGRGLKSAA